MLRPSLGGLALLANKNPAIAGLAEDSFTIILAGAWVGDNERWRGIFGALSGKAALAMGIPRNGAVSRIWAEADPLVARRAEDTVGLELSYIGV
jgi:hypothetical protein